MPHNSKKAKKSKEKRAEKEKYTAEKDGAGQDAKEEGYENTPANQSSAAGPTGKQDAGKKRKHDSEEGTRHFKKHRLDGRTTAEVAATQTGTENPQGMGAGMERVSSDARGKKRHSTGT